MARASDRDMNAAAEILWPATELRKRRAVDESFDLAGRPVEARFSRLKTPLVLTWDPGSTAYKPVARPGRATLMRARATTAPSGAACVITLVWESETVGTTTLGTVSIPPGARFGEATVPVEVATLPAGAWVSASVTTANGATGVSTALTVDVT